MRFSMSRTKSAKAVAIFLVLTLTLMFAMPVMATGEGAGGVIQTVIIEVDQNTLVEVDLALYATAMATKNALYNYLKGANETPKVVALKGDGKRVGLVEYATNYAAQGKNVAAALGATAALPGETLAKVNELVSFNEETGEPELKPVVPTTEVTVVNVSDIEDINVDFGTAIDEITFPAKVTLNLSDETTAEVDAIFACDTYDGNVAGEYVFNATYELPEGVTGYKPAATVKVVVGADPQIAIEAAAEEAVAAYEAAAITTAEEITAAEALEVTANEKVALVADADKKTAFEARIAAKKADVEAKKVELARPVVESVSAINATTIQVVLAEAPAAELTNADADEFAIKVNGTAVANATAVTKLASDLTGKTYRLTIATLTGQQGSLSVNGTEAAVGQGLVYAFDFKAAQVTNIEVKGAKTLIVTFDEKVKDTTIAANSFDITRVTGGATPTISQAVLDTTGTKVTLTLATNDLILTDYYLTVSNAAGTVVRDIANNATPTTELAFRPTAEQLADKLAPEVVAASYDNGRGLLEMTFSKDVTVANLDVTKIKISDVQLTAATTKAQTAANKITLTLAAATKTSVNAIEGALSIVAAEGAFTDGTTATAGQTFSNVTKLSPAVIQSASYNQETKVLKLVFDQPVKIQNLANIKVDDAVVGSEAVATGATNPDGTALTVPTTKAQATWELKLTSGAGSESAKLEANNKEALKVYMAEDAVRNDSTTVIKNVATTYANGGVAVTFVADVTKPFIESATYVDTGTLTITFNEALNGTDDGAANILAMKAADKVIIDTAATATANRVTLAAQGVAIDGTNKAVFAATIVPGDQTKLFNMYQSDKPIKLWIAKDTVTDNNALKNEATTFATGIVVTFNDFTLPTVVGAGTSTISNTHVKVTFSEKVTAATAEDTANYVIKDLTQEILAVTSAKLQADGVTVILTTAAQTSGKPYNLTVSNVRDLSNNVIAGSNTAGLTGNGTQQTTAVSVSSLTAASVAGPSNDTLTIVFSADIDPIQAMNLANYAVLEATANTDDAWLAATAVKLSDAAITATASNTVKITLDSYSLKDGKFYKVVVSNIQDIYGNALAADGKQAIHGAPTALAVVAPTVTMTQYDTKDRGVKLVFSEKMVETQATNAGNYQMDTDGAGAMETATLAEYSYSESTGKTTVWLTFPTTQLTAGVGNAKKIVVNNNVTNLGLKPMASTDIAGGGVVLDGVAPKIATVVATTVAGAANDTIVVTFSENVVAASVTDKGNWVIKDGSGTVIPAVSYSITPGANTATIKFDGDGDATKAYSLKTGATYMVEVNGVMDATGNEAVDSKSAVAAGDTTAFTFATGNVTATGGGAVITVDVSGDKYVPETITKDKFTVRSATDADFTAAGAAITNYVIASVVYSADTITINLTTNLETADATAEVEIKVAAGIEDLAGNANEAFTVTHVID